MELSKTALTSMAKYRRIAFIFLVGSGVIGCIALGIVYLQQRLQQRALENQIAGINLAPRGSSTSLEVLQANYDNITKALTPIADNATIAMLVDIARKNGIDINETSGKFRVPIASRDSSGSYQLTSFKGIHVQGDPDNVLAFIRTLDSDEMLQLPGSSAPRAVVRVITRAVIEDIEVTPGGEEGARRAEFRSIIAAVKSMMIDNALSTLPHPVSFSLGKATNRMGDDPTTLDTFEGFPDFITTAAKKGYTGNVTLKDGYLLWQHDKIFSDNTTKYSTINYTQTLTTTYYYTAEEDGAVRQWSGSNVALAVEYPSSTPTKMELVASVDIKFYFKLK